VQVGFMNSFEKNYHL